MAHKGAREQAVEALQDCIRYGSLPRQVRHKTEQAVSRLEQSIIHARNTAEQRDQLLAALERAVAEAVADDLDDWFANAKAAIAAVKGPAA
ncbi:hypothetical protein [Chromobacterium subtsugae]|uniref:hypothetical protein n=1 Tax=Chromobacterium subtsugae TaxID=251747 RepID=UPI000B1CAAB6|nr:hypothetical protein [Chromobacterium subtsugae]